MSLDPPAAAARRRYVLDRIVEDLVGWGCPLAYAEPRAQQLLDRVLDVGYRLPTSVDDHPTAGGTSTPAGRTRARILFVHHLGHVNAEGWTHCACRAWSGPVGDHDRHVAAMLVVAGVATRDEMALARPHSGVGAPEPRRTGQDTREAPPEPHRGVQPVQRQDSDR